MQRWPISDLTGKQVKLVLRAPQPDKKVFVIDIFGKTWDASLFLSVQRMRHLLLQTVLVVGASHLRSLVDGFVSMPKGPVLYSYLSVPGATASEIKTEVLHAEVPFTPDAVCVMATSNNLGRGLVTDAGKDFRALLATACSRWPKVCVCLLLAESTLMTRLSLLHHFVNYIFTNLVLFFATRTPTGVCDRLPHTPDCATGPANSTASRIPSCCW